MSDPSSPATRAFARLARGDLPALTDAVLYDAIAETTQAAYAHGTARA